MKKKEKVEWLDGDQVREVFPQTGFSKSARNDHLKRIGFLASRLQAHGVSVICSFVSPYQESRDFARKLSQKFIEVYVSTPLEICEKRDVKGHYAKARSGKIQNFTGVSGEFEVPKNTELVIDASKMTVEQATGKILEILQL